MVNPQGALEPQLQFFSFQKVAKSETPKFHEISGNQTDFEKKKLCGTPNESPLVWYLPQHIPPIHPDLITKDTLLSSSVYAAEKIDSCL